MKDLTKFEGTIAFVLNKHIKEIYELGKTPSQFPKLKKFVSDLLLSEELSTNKVAKEANNALSKCNYSRYMSTLTTYMIGEKVIK